MDEEDPYSGTRPWLWAGLLVLVLVLARTGGCQSPSGGVDPGGFLEQAGWGEAGDACEVGSYADFWAQERARARGSRGTGLWAGRERRGPCSESPDAEDQELRQELRRLRAEVEELRSRLKERR